MTFRTEQLLAIVQIATGLAVVASLALILFQMQQNEKLASAQLTSETLANIQQLESMVMGEDYATTIEKINDPNAKLTEADLYRYDAYTFSTQTAWRRMLLLTDLGFHLSLIP